MAMLDYADLIVLLICLNDVFFVSCLEMVRYQNLHGH